MAEFLRHNGPTYRTEVEQIELTSYGPQPDPDWRCTDHAGHEHDASRETLVMVQDDPDEPPFYTDEDGEEYNAPTHLECRLCGEHIEPGVVGPSPFRSFIPGATHYYRDEGDGEAEITEAEFMAAVNDRSSSGE